MKLNFVIIALGILGLLPFFFSVYWVIDKQIIFGLTPFKVFSTYSSVILTFLAGSLWADIIVSREKFALTPNQITVKSSAVRPNENIAIAFAIFSNILALVCWALLILPEEFYVISLTVQLLGFVIVLWVEACWGLMQKKVDRDGYLSLRCLLTSVVCLAHIGMMRLN
jgi:hypothetical protein